MQAWDGHLDGIIDRDLPENGHWRVKFEFCMPGQRSVMAQCRQVFCQNLNKAWNIEVNINGVTQTLVVVHSLSEHKEEEEIIMNGQRLTFHFQLHSSKGVRQIHPFLTAAEVLLMRDRLPPPEVPWARGYVT